MSRILLVYSSVNGQTYKIAQFIQQQLKEHQIKLCALDDAFTLDIAEFDRVLIGASVRYGNYRKDVFSFIDKHHDFLVATDSGFFSVNLTARKPEKKKPEHNRYMTKFFQNTPWRPKHLGVFAGALKYSQYKWWQTLLIQMIMKMTGGTTDSSRDYEFTDWKDVSAFSRQFVL